MFSTYLKHFPEGMTPRPAQAKILPQIEEAFENHKFVILCAPTGTGKSFISKTIANVSDEASQDLIDMIENYDAYKKAKHGEYKYIDDVLKQPPFGTFVLTPSKALQDQYKDLFDDMVVLKGKANHLCNIDTKYTVDVAPCVLTPDIMRRCQRDHVCSYYEKRNEALSSKVSVLNYDMFFSIPEHLRRKNFIVCDEASELEDAIIKQFNAWVSYKGLDKMGINYEPIPTEKTNDVTFGWLNDIIIEAEEALNTVQNDMRGQTRTANKLNIQKLQYLKRIVNDFTVVRDNWLDCEYIIQRSEDPRNPGVAFTPLRVNSLAQRIFDSSEKVLLMSATIIDPKNFAKSLGITDYKYIEIETSFDPKKAPVYLDKGNPISYKNYNVSLPKMGEFAKKLCDAHKNDKGIIHTQSGTVLRALKKYLVGSRFLWREDDDKNETILKKHMNSPGPTVLISPSMTHGIDLKGDLAKFQIIAKAPFLPMGDKRISRMKDLDQDWYTNKMIITLVQSAGRGVRCEEDICETYCLDGNIHKTLKRKWKDLPKYFKDRIV